MLATMSEAVREYAYAVGQDKPYTQWILSDYDSWERNPFYVGPDQGHPEYGDAPICSVYATYKEAAEHARKHAMYQNHPIKVTNHKNLCWVVWY